MRRHSEICGAFCALVLVAGACGDDGARSDNVTGAGPVGAGANAAGTPVAGATSVAGAPVAGTPPVAGQPVSGTDGGGAPPAGSFAFKTSCSAPELNASPGNPCKGSGPPPITLTRIADSQGPVFLDQAPGDPSRLYVVEQLGKIRVIKDGVMQPTPLLDMTQASPRVVTAGERGLLGMAFHPDFANNKKFYVNYTSPDTVIMEFVMTDPDSVAASSGSQILTVSQPFDNHNGGMVAFGADGCLYIGFGDGGMGGDPMGNGQNKNTPLASMLRIDADNYPIAAPGNIGDGYEHIWAWGLRNPWRFSFDLANGDLYIGDVGQGIGGSTGVALEEVNIEPRGLGGQNYGWSSQEGLDCRAGDCSSFRQPVTVYRGASAFSFAPSVIGGYVYRGSAIPEMVGRYIYADWTDAELLTLIYSGENAGQPAICDEFSTGVTVSSNVRGFGQDLAGEIYVLSSGGYDGNATGGVYRIDPQ